MFATYCKKKVIKATILIILIAAVVGDEILNFTKKCVEGFCNDIQSKINCFF
jgi:hypothetical protein